MLKGNVILLWRVVVRRRRRLPVSAGRPDEDRTQSLCKQRAAHDQVIEFVAWLLHFAQLFTSEIILNPCVYH